MYVSVLVTNHVNCLAISCLHNNCCVSQWSIHNFGKNEVCQSTRHFTLPVSLLCYLPSVNQVDEGTEIEANIMKFAAGINETLELVMDGASNVQVSQNPNSSALPEVGKMVKTEAGVSCFVHSNKKSRYIRFPGLEILFVY